MAKKYVPSGYQIINVVVNPDDTTKLIDSEDKKILKELLQNSEFKKPVLLQIHDLVNGHDMSGFATFDSGTLILSFGITYNYSLYIDSDDIVVGLYEE